MGSFFTEKILTKNTNGGDGGDSNSPSWQQCHKVIHKF